MSKIREIQMRFVSPTEENKVEDVGTLLNALDKCKDALEVSKSLAGNTMIKDCHGEIATQALKEIFED